MILSDNTIRDKLYSGEMSIIPFTKGNIQPASYDLTLGNHFTKIFENLNSCLTMDDPIEYYDFDRDEIVIPPQSFILARTQEYIKIPDDIAAFVEGRSSVGRMGLFIQNAGWVDPGFEGTITLELFNATRLPIRLQAGRRICQLVFAQMDRPALNPYRGKYQGQIKSTGSRIHLDE